MILGDLYGSTGGLDFCCIKAEELTKAFQGVFAYPIKKGTHFREEDSGCYLYQCVEGV